jgi:hypothetical protein
VQTVSEIIDYHNRFGDGSNRLFIRSFCQIGSLSPPYFATDDLA